MHAARQSLSLIVIAPVVALGPGLRPGIGTYSYTYKRFHGHGSSHRNPNVGACGTPNYFKPGLPYMDGVEVIMLGDATSQYPKAAAAPYHFFVDTSDIRAAASGARRRGRIAFERRRHQGNPGSALGATA